MSDALANARAIAAAATPGPWGAADGGSFGGWWISLNGDPSNVTIAAVPIKLADAEFIAMARNIFPAMLDAIEAAGVYVETPPPARTIGQAEDLCGFLDRVLDLIGGDDE